MYCIILNVFWSCCKVFLDAYVHSMNKLTLFYLLWLASISMFPQETIAFSQKGEIQKQYNLNNQLKYHHVLAYMLSKAVNQSV